MQLSWFKMYASRGYYGRICGESKIPKDFRFSRRWIWLLSTDLDNILPDYTASHCTRLTNLETFGHPFRGCSTTERLLHSCLLTRPWEPPQYTVRCLPWQGCRREGDNSAGGGTVLVVCSDSGVICVGDATPILEKMSACWIMLPLFIRFTCSFQGHKAWSAQQISIALTFKFRIIRRHLNSSLRLFIPKEGREVPSNRPLQTVRGRYVYTQTPSSVLHDLAVVTKSADS